MPVPFRALSTTEQRASARSLLLAAADFYRKRRGSMMECLDLAATDLLVREYARRVLRGVTWSVNIWEWEAHPMRRRSDVWRVLKMAIRWCSRRAGGWCVGRTVRSAVAKVPADRQWLEWTRGRA